MTMITVIVATCGRPRELYDCLVSLSEQRLPAARIVVVDDAPGGDQTPQVVAGFDDPDLLYVTSARRGLAAAHNAGLCHVATPLVAFTDDDVIADPLWLEGLVAGFDDPAVACVTGRIVAFELLTEAQRLLDAYAGFDKGDVRRVVDPRVALAQDPLFPFATGACGSGANMAFRTAWLTGNGGFDPALGAGTRARGGDDLAAFFDVLQQGHRLVYEPAAIVLHRHARDFPALERTVFGYGVGLGAYLIRSLVKHPELAGSAIRRIPLAIQHFAGPRSAKNARLTETYPTGLKLRERLGVAVGPFAYAASRRAA